MKFALFILLLMPFTTFCQQQDDWLHLDPENDHVLGISSYRAYEFLKDKKADTVIVAIIDNGAELTHIDLQNQFWTNQYEIANNGIDDDHNGYVDDINGWNFIGNAKGENVRFDMTGLTRCYGILKKKYDGKAIENIQSTDLSEYNTYLELKKEHELEVGKKNEEIAYHQKILDYYVYSEDLIKQHLKKDTIVIKDLGQIKSKKKEIKSAKTFLLQVYQHNQNKQELVTLIDNLNRDLQTRLNTEFNIREQIVGDDPNNLSDSIYGNNLLNATGPYHGTSVASVVGALQNGLGMNGIAKCVKLMIIRIVPNGDERDKDIALAFRYAIRNGASIINCSFAKKYSEHYEFVQDAILEAEKQHVLIIHAAGNLGTNNDEIPYFPTGMLKDGSMAPNWINVGASCSEDDKKVVAFFSNYGRKTVDIFAPGFNIHTCALNNCFDKSSGTSIAAPVVCGIAAVIKSYYPYLTANQIKEVILKSAYIPKTNKVLLPGENESVYTDFFKLSASGGIANLYKAILLIEKEYKK